MREYYYTKNADAILIKNSKKIQDNLENPYNLFPKKRANSVINPLSIDIEKKRREQVPKNLQNATRRPTLTAIIPIIVICCLYLEKYLRYFI